jgi:hypothetical protein
MQLGGWVLQHLGEPPCSVAEVSHRRIHLNRYFGKRTPAQYKKALRIFSGALLIREDDALIDLNIIRIPRADHPL